MCRRSALLMVLLSLLGWVSPRPADARPGPLVCKLEEPLPDGTRRGVCPLPTQCQVRAAEKCVRGRCPALANAPDGTACDDGDATTAGDVCSQGVCGAGAPLPCPDDGNPCTTEVRGSDGVCRPVNLADGTACSDGNACTAPDACRQGVCRGEPVQCPDDGNACTASTCRPDGTCGHVNVADGTSCDDGSACTTGDACASGVCKGTGVACEDDGNPCTASACGPSGCTHANVPDGTACSDGNACTVNDSCQAGTCLTGVPLTCSSPSETCVAPGGCATDCGPAGCQVMVAAAGDPTLTVPSGALTANVRITMEDLGGDPANASVFHVYDLGPDGTTFAVPATIDLPAPPLAAGHTAVIEVSSNGTDWTAVPTTLGGGRLTGPIAHFSFCRTRDVAPSLTADLEVFDMMEFQDFDNLQAPDPACNPGFDLFGVCVTVNNPGAAPVTAATARIHSWQCYNRGFVDGVGEVCLPGLLVVCGHVDIDLTTKPGFPAGGIPPGGTFTFKHDLQGSPPFGCLGSSFVGVDVTLREPTATDPRAGMRSAQGGPFVEINNTPVPFAGVYPRSKTALGGGANIKDFLIDSRE